MFGFYHEWRHHLRCIITVPYGGTIRMLKVRWMIQNKDTFDDKVGKEKYTYNIRLENAIMSNKNNPILWYRKGDIDPIKIYDKDRKTELITIIDEEGKKIKIDPSTGKAKLYHVTLHSKVAEDVLNEGKSKTMFLIIGLFVVAIIGIGLYSQFMLSQQNDKILLLTKRLTEALVNSTKSGGVIVR